MTKNTILITGANGEVGHALIKKLAAEAFIVATDITELDESLRGQVASYIQADITDRALVNEIVDEHAPATIFHLAARLSTLGEKDPLLAHDVNVNGTAYLLNAATKLSLSQSKPVMFVYPSTIAVYGLPSLSQKADVNRVKEDKYLKPITMYGINKLYGETLGVYFSSHYQLLEDVSRENLIDFRAVRFPGLLSADTLPTGGTSDYASEMIHSAAQNVPYACFVRPDSAIPFMAMPDAVSALVKLSESRKESLTRRVYNVAAFSATAEELAQKTQTYFPQVQITYEVDKLRQQIVDSWPIGCDDTAARLDWNWEPDYTFDTTFSDYLVPAITKRYS